MRTGTVGEITVAERDRAREYYGDGPATQRTGATDGSTPATSGYRDHDGFLWITGRSKDIIIRGGHNISPGEVEEVLYAHPAVVEAVVAGIPHDVAWRGCGSLGRAAGRIGDQRSPTSGRSFSTGWPATRCLGGRTS